MKVVVVEDDPIIGWRLTQQLGLIGCTVLAHFDAFLEAENAIHFYDPDLVISNLKLSDGWIDKRYLEIMSCHSNQLLIVTAMRSPVYSEDLSLEIPIYRLYKPYSDRQFKNAMIEIYLHT